MFSSIKDAQKFVKNHDAKKSTFPTDTSEFTRSIKTQLTLYLQEHEQALKQGRWYLSESARAICEGRIRKLQEEVQNAEETLNDSSLFCYIASLLIINDTSTFGDVFDPLHYVSLLENLEFIVKQQARGFMSICLMPCDEQKNHIEDKLKQQLSEREEEVRLLRKFVSLQRKNIASLETLVNENQQELARLRVLVENTPSQSEMSALREDHFRLKLILEKIIELRPELVSLTSANTLTALPPSSSAAQRYPALIDASHTKAAKQIDSCDTIERATLVDLSADSNDLTEHPPRITKMAVPALVSSAKVSEDTTISPRLSSSSRLTTSESTSSSTVTATDTIELSDCDNQTMPPNTGHTALLSLMSTETASVTDTPKDTRSTLQAIA